MSVDLYIAAGVLQTIERSGHDLTGIPPETSLIDEAIWATLCKEAGDETALIAALGLKDERRTEYD